MSKFQIDQMFKALVGAFAILAVLLWSAVCENTSDPSRQSMSAVAATQVAAHLACSEARMGTGTVMFQSGLFPRKAAMTWTHHKLVSCKVVKIK